MALEKFVRMQIKEKYIRLYKKTLNIGLLSLLLTSCSVGGMVYDDIFGSGNSATDNKRRPVGTSPTQGSFNQPNQFYGQQSALAEIGYAGAGSGSGFGMMQNQMPPVQYGAPNMPVYNAPQPMASAPQPMQNQQMGYNGFMPQMQANPWVALPPPSYAQQQIAPQYQYGYQQPQQPAPQPMMMPMQAQYQQPPMQQPQVQYQPQPQMMAMQPQQMQHQPMANSQAPIISETPAFATPNIMPNNGNFQNALGLGAPSYVTQITNTPQQNQVMPAPQQLLPQQNIQAIQNPVAPQQEQAQPMQMQQNQAQNINNNNNNNNNNQNNAENLDIDELLEPLSNDNTMASNDKILPLNIPEDANTNLQVNESNLAVPVENISQNEMAEITNQNQVNNSEPEVDEILRSPTRSAYTPASSLIDNMQQRGRPANISNLSNNANLLNTPLDFDQFGNPVVPASFNKTVSLNQNPGLYNYQAPIQQPASLNINNGNNLNNPANPLQQRVNEMRL